MARRVAIDPVSRVEGHGKVTLLVDDDHHITEARLHIVEFRGFEKFIQGRPYWELPLVVQRLCGICPVSHHLAAAKAIDQIAGVDQLTEPALALRKLMHFAQVLQSHALHFFHLASPDLLFGFDSDVAKRNIVAVIRHHQTLALQGVRIRKFGQQVIEAISGKRIHGIAAVPGGMNQPLTADKITPFKQQVTDIITWCDETVQTVRDLFQANRDFHENFGTAPAAFLSLVGPQDQLELYDGEIKVIDANGQLLHRQPCDQYHHLLQEQVKSWSYMKFPFLSDLTPDTGWYRVGPLARLNTCSHIDTPKAEQRRQEYQALLGKTVQAPLAYHWSRMIEALHCAEAIAVLLDDPALLSDDLVNQGNKRREGIGIIEAPRGTLIHHYRINEQDQVTMANLIVSTTNNNQAMNESIRRVANDHLNGRELTPELLNLVEVAIRAYDPCLSCATHAAGKMPLQLELMGTDGARLGSLTRHSDGSIQHAD
ncbi:Ni/Fe hydrogenase subunit alpha [Ketobacter sp.]|uniref:Ni/Fe hydrogenase subunit alpha n=1 Tax=Ketobacter sp. TaxID=2083498 RepID=UPI000F214C1A|nr:Ni/Fe hydrogenase subunit alpha [Ketobacter sp.]RLU01542.1 MAG: Ni/Fe hydrogenase subunit alpha [Ketobacter sp.]